MQIQTSFFLAMKDFLGVFVLLILVFGSMALFVYLMFYLDYAWFAFFQIVLSTVIILLFIKYFRSHRYKK
ncbi:Flp pilus assembly protein TadB [Catalinimonas alkaloidigena]|nr:Flp pilus assembly protein TadB [Catalinimonas alkaloidigena]